MRITEGKEPIGEAPTGTVFATKEASIVHVNVSGRIATIRNGGGFESGDFLIVKDREGKETGVLKALPKRPIGLRTADILEGSPDINNVVVTASADRAERLSKIYRDPDGE